MASAKAPTPEPTASDSLQHSYKQISHLEAITTRCSIHTIQSLAGASAGLASSIVTCPLDVIKTSLQGKEGLQSRIPDSGSVPPPFQDRGLVGTGRLIWHERGLGGMYRGLGPTVLAYLPRWAIYFSVYHKSQEALNLIFGLQQSWISSCISAASAGICSTVFINPLWVIRTRLMSQTSISGSYTSALDVSHKMYHNEGISSFYSGLTPALLGVAHLAIQFPLYERLKRILTGSGLGGWADGDDRSEVLGILMASSLSKMCAGAATYPHEVIRTRLQTQRGGQSASGQVPRHNRSQRDKSCYGSKLRRRLPVQYHGIIHTTRTILREEGWRALYAGMGTSMIRAIPASCTTMLVYEGVVYVLKKSRANGERKLRLGDGSDNPSGL